MRTRRRIDANSYVKSGRRGCRASLGFVALVIHPDKLAVEHFSLVGIAHVVVGSGVWEVQLLPEQVIFYFYWRVFRKKRSLIRILAVFETS